VFVEDKVSAIGALMNDSNKKGSYNISTGWIYNQKDIVLKILENFKGLEPTYAEGDIPQQIDKQSLKSIKWDWQPEWNFEDALKATIKSFEQYRSDWK
jgi:nucleoside-diphosphate-sugar epimerase